MNRWLFWNIEGFVILLLMLALAYTVYRGILRTEEAEQLTVKKRFVALVVAIVLFVVVSWLVSFLIG